MVHLPATIPEQLSGVRGHMKQRAVIILPLAAEVPRQRSRLSELLAGTTAPMGRVAPAVPCGVSPGPAAMAILTPFHRDPSLLAEGITSFHGGQEGNSWAQQAGVEALSMWSLTCASPMVMLMMAQLILPQLSLSLLTSPVFRFPLSLPKP